MRYCLAIDLGTGALKVGLVGEDGSLLAHLSSPIESHYRSDIKEATQDPNIWWLKIIDLTKAILEANPISRQIVAVGVTGQWASTVPVDEDARPTGDCLLWLDERGERFSKEVVGGRVMGYNASAALRFIRKSGGAPSRFGADPIGHIRFIEDQQLEVAKRSRWYLEPVDYITMRLTGVASATHASMTASWLTDNRNLDRMAYDNELVGIAKVPASKLPPLRRVGEVISTILPKVAVELGLSPDVQVVTGVPDLHSGALGSDTVEEGSVHLCLSTTSWISTVRRTKKTDILHSIATVPGVFEGEYLVANNHETAGECLDWLSTNVIPPTNPSTDSATWFEELNRMALGAAPGSGGLIFTPWLAGERSPVDDKTLRSSWIGLTLSTRREEMVRSLFEGVALSNRWLFDPFRKFVVGTKVEKVAMFGGGATSALWCALHAAALEVSVEVISDPTFVNLKGAGYLGLIGVGLVNRSDLHNLVEVGSVYEPDSILVDVARRSYPIFAKSYPATRRISKALAAL